MTQPVPQRYDRPVKVVALIALAAGLAHADSKTAETAAADGDALAEKGQFAAAAAKFREAYRAEPRPELMCNVGVAYYKAEDLPRAQRYLEQCVQVGMSVDPAFISTVKQVLASLDTSLRAGNFTPVDFLIEPTLATIAAVGNEPFDEPIVGGRRVWFPYGSFSVVIHAEGFADQTIPIAAAGHEAIGKTITLERAKPVVPPAPAPPPRPSYAVPIVSAVVGGVSGGAAVGFYFIALKRTDTANGLTNAATADSYNAARDSAHAWQYAAIGAGVIGVVAASYAIYSWLHVRHAAVAIEPSPNGAALSITGSF